MTSPRAARFIRSANVPLMLLTNEVRCTVSIEGIIAIVHAWGVRGSANAPCRPLTVVPGLRIQHWCPVAVLGVPPESSRPRTASFHIESIDRLVE